MSIVASSQRASETRRSRWREINLVAVAALQVYSAALGWQAQKVSYPLYRVVNDHDFPAYHQHYNRAIPIVVIVPGFACFLSTIAFRWTHPRHVSTRLASAVTLTGAISLISTVCWAIPRHDALDRDGKLDSTIDSLLHANLVRSVSLTAGALTLGWCLVQGLLSENEPTLAS